jgi:hypothetical protein
MTSTFFYRNKFKSISLHLESEGLYDARDSEWNYSDIPHLNYIHSRVEGVVLSSTRTHITNIFLQKIGPFLLPAIVHIEHVSRDLHSYYIAILNISISVETLHFMASNKCVTKTDYRFFYNDFLGHLVALLARFATRRNYKLLMSEDMPMRIQRGALRKRGVTFISDEREIIGFTDTLDITSNNVDCKIASCFNNLYEVFIDRQTGSAIDDFHFLSLTWTDWNLNLYPTICPHEGASLLRDRDLVSSTCTPTTQKICPWHGKRIAPLASIRLDTIHNIHFTAFNVELVLAVAPHVNSIDDRSGYLLRLGPKCPEV